ncbi:MAG: 30S ribosomal protein S6 [Clostridia bacterium]|nr:30S ribosomal protein S6 [Clostridia bacterium]MBR2052543.1 30S ribosomal protein S6 [Clostridia bacterium]MBR2220887.1 30S ribosomal protein S6 [Clostridia bacterium]MBR2433207.1 30S ribosomal protein S6 [Clostridia bacterium]
MKKYELLYAISATVNEAQREEIIAKWSKFIEERGGKILTLDKWGMRKFAYPIKFQNEGFYVLSTFEAAPSLIREMENAMNIFEPVVRKMFVALED